MRNPGFTILEPFRFTRSERNAAFTLSILCLLILYIPLTYEYLKPPPQQVDFTAFEADIQAFCLAALAASPATSFPDEQHRNEAPRPSEAALFAFDPNTVSKDELLRLGLSERATATFLKYRSTGARFYKKEDLKKVFSIRAEDYARLEAWIHIEKPEPFARQEADEQKAFSKAVDYPPYEKKSYPAYTPKAPVNIDINSASLEDWQQLRGIGQGYAKRIVNFREKLGGFASVTQVGETFNLPDSVFQQALPNLMASPPVLRKIKVNAATAEELKAHPYFSNFQATVLLNYRQQHGNFADLAALKKIQAAFKESDWARLEPYLSFE